MSVVELETFGGLARFVRFDVRVAKEHAEIGMAHKLHREAIRYSALPKQGGIGVPEHVRRDVDSALL